VATQHVSIAAGTGALAWAVSAGDATSTASQSVLRAISRSSPANAPAGVGALA
jgi:hypothetical protein